MNILFTVFIILGIEGILYPLLYIFAQKWYVKNPESEMTYQYELLDTVFRHKKLVPIIFAAGIISFIAAAFIFGHIV